MTRHGTIAKPWRWRSLLLLLVVLGLSLFPTFAEALTLSLANPSLQKGDSTEILIGDYSDFNYISIFTNTAICKEQNFLLTAVDEGDCEIWVSDSGIPISKQFIIKITASVAKNAQTINFPALTDQTITTGNLALQASASSGLAISYQSLTPSLCGIENNQATLLTPGTCIIRASQAGNETYEAATSIERSFIISKAAQSSLLIIPAQSSLYTGETIAINLGGGSGIGDETLSREAGPCDITGNYLTARDAGDCTIRAYKAADAQYEAQTALLTLTILAPETLALSISPNSISINETATLSTSGGTGSGAISYHLQSGTCEISGDKISAKQAGECAVIARKAASGSRPEQESAVMILTISGKLTIGLAEPALVQSVSAQVASAANFSGVQLGNVSQRLDALSSARPAFSMNLQLAHADKSQTMPIIFAANDDPEAKPRESRFAGWVNGTLIYGRKTNDNEFGGKSRNSFTSAGLTIGADYKRSKSFITGGGFGFGEASHDIGAHSRMDGKFFSSLAYSQWDFGNWGRLDFISGAATGYFTIDRYSSGGSTTLHGKRQALQAYSAIRYGEDFDLMDNWRMSPTLRMDAMWMRLGPYDEQGALLWQLSYGALESQSYSISPGLRSQMHFQTAWGNLTPAIHAEYHFNLSGGYQQAFTPSQFPGPSYLVREKSKTQSAITTGASLLAEHGNHWQADLDYSFSTDLGGAARSMSHALSATIRLQF